MKEISARSIRGRLTPIAFAVALVVSGCSGDQLGTTNDGLAAAPINGTAVGVVAGVALVGVLLAADSDDDNGGIIGGDDSGNTTDGGTTGGGTDGGGTTGTGTGGTGGTDGGGTTGTGTGGTDGGGTTGTGTGGTDGGGTTGTGTGGTDGGGTTGTGTGGTDGGGTTGTGTGGTDGGGTDGTGTGGTDGGGTDGTGGTDGGTDGGSNDGVLQGDGQFSAVLGTSELVPAGSGDGLTGSAVANLLFDRSSGDASGDVVLTGVDADRVDVMLGPPGSNGFVAVALENEGNGRWVTPADLSVQQRAILLQNINLGNLYVLASTTERPNGVLRRHILPAEVTAFTSSAHDGDMESLGYLMLNTNTREYALTMNTENAPSLISSHLFEGDSEVGETVIRDLSQRPSNPTRFFGYGTLSESEVQALQNGLYSLDVHDVDDNQLLFAVLE